MKKSLVMLPLLCGMSLITAQKKHTSTAPATTNYTDDQKASYYIGLNMAQNMKAQGFNVDVNMLSQAMKNELGGKPSALPKEEMQNFLRGYMQKLNEKKQAEMKIKAEENKKKGEEYLAKNKANPTVKTTASGLQYEVIKEGDGINKPKATDIVKVTYTGKLTDGTVFDSTEKNGGQPVEFPLNGVIKGWTEGLQLMSKGSKYKFYIPSDLAYGERGAGASVPPGSVLVFDVELLDLKAPEAPKTTTPPPTPAPAPTK